MEIKSPPAYESITYIDVEFGFPSGVRSFSFALGEGDIQWGKHPGFGKVPRRITENKTGVSFYVNTSKLEWFTYGERIFKKETKTRKPLESQI